MIKTGVPYRAGKVGGPYDAIVIGSGIGGLTAAALLAQHGSKRVLVLERHYVAGGFTHTFQRKDYEWDVGVHYIGEVNSPRSPVRRLFDHLSDGALQWASLGDVYDRIFIGDDAYDFRSGRERFVEGLSSRFPGKRAGIDAYVRTVERLHRASKAYFTEKALPQAAARVMGGALRWPFLRLARRTTADVLRSCTTDRRLAAVLAGQFGDYGLPPRQSSFAIHAMVAHHYLEGAAYPIGGASAIAATIVPGIEEAGGRVLIAAEVERVTVEDGRAVGIRLQSGEEIRAPLVVSDAGVVNTYRRLLPADVCTTRRLEARLMGIEPSVGHLCLYVGLRHTAEELGLSAANLWLYPGEDHDANVAAFLHDPEAAFPVVYVSFPSVKDPTFNDRYPGRSTIDLITFASYDWFARWADRRWHQRGEEYEELKERFAQRLLAALYARLPQLRGKVDTYELSTPLSTRHFAHYARGELYGLAHTPARFAHRGLRPATPVPGLYLAGQDVASAGVAGALFGGVLCASAILRRNLLGVVLRGA